MSKIKENSMIIDGIGAAETVDSSGEILDIKGCDISSLKEGKGVLNWEHQGPPKNDDEKKKGVQDTPKNAIGKVIFAKKIFNADDCEDERQKFFFKKINKVPYIYIKARLYDGSGHEDAKAAAASFRDAVLHNEASIINFSIEGHTIEKKDNRILISMARAVAATHKPCNKAAVATVLHDPVTGEKHEIEGKKKDELSELATVDKNEIPGKQTLSSVPVDYNCIVEDPIGKSESLEKALSAGMGGGAPGTLTQGAALQREELKQVAKKKIVTTFLKNQFLGALRDYDPYSKQTFKAFLKSRLPEVDDSFIDYFDEMAKEFRMRKSEDHLVRRLEFLTLELVKNNAQGFTVPAQPGEAGAMQEVKTPGGSGTGYHTTTFSTDDLPERAPEIPPPPPKTPIHKDMHMPRHLALHPEQGELVHGLDIDQDSDRQLLYQGIFDAKRVKLANGGHGVLKPAVTVDVNYKHIPHTAYAETVFHNAAKSFFGLGKYVPTTSYIEHPNTGHPHSVMQVIEGGRHYWDEKDEHGRDVPSQKNLAILKAHGDAGELDKLAMMDSIMGNNDRHGGNYMLDDNQIHMIDHGNTFDFGNKDLYNGGGYQPYMPAYLEHYHQLRTGGSKTADWLGIKLHPDAAKWVMELQPQALTSLLRSQGLSSKTAMQAGKRLVGIQRLIQQKGLNTGVWEAYNQPYGENSTLGHALRGEMTPNERLAAQQEAANAAANAV